MYRRPVASTLIRSIGYDLASSVLEVEFVAGHVYEYYDVALSIYSELMAAESVGTFFNDHVKDMYTYRRVDEDEVGQEGAGEKDDGAGSGDPAPSS